MNVRLYKCTSQAVVTSNTYIDLIILTSTYTSLPRNPAYVYTYYMYPLPDIYTKQYEELWIFVLRRRRFQSAKMPIRYCTRNALTSLVCNV
jgi:hypothetical protein